jgi:EAL domain-containing protein (putative c-di-GMP-specific phosphodiesterase class I)
VRISINLSLHDVRQSGLAHHVAEVAAARGADVARLDLELGETTLLREGERAAELVAEGAALGLGFAVDDFGTGSSSLVALRRLPIDKLKMDGSVLRGAPADRDAAAVATSILRLAATLDLATTAEQVETPSELAFLRAQGCPLGQGHLLCPTLSTDEALALVRRGRVDA